MFTNDFKAELTFYSYPLFEVQLTAGIQMKVYCLQVETGEAYTA